MLTSRLFAGRGQISYAVCRGARRLYQAVELGRMARSYREERRPASVVSRLECCIWATVLRYGHTLWHICSCKASDSEREAQRWHELLTSRAFRRLVGPRHEDELRRTDLNAAVGALAGNPFFAIKTRMQVYSTSAELRVGTQHADRSLFGALQSVYKEEGVKGFFRGIDAFIPRVMFYGAAQLATYDALKNRLRSWERGPPWATQPGFPQHALCGFMAAVVSVTVIQPFDFIAVRMQNQNYDATTGKGALYSSPLDCVKKVVRTEGGPLALFKGYRANAIRFGPYTVLIFVFVEEFRTLFNQLLPS
jgi:hypothetical protein